METTRQTILNILRRRRQATVGELTTELGLAPATIRRHLDILTRDAHVEVTQVRRQTGRPHYLFSLSDAGEDLFPKHYVEMTCSLIEEIVGLAPEETAGRSGSELADLVFEKMAHRIAQRIGPRIHGSTLAERLQPTTEALVEEGILFDVEQADGGYLLVGHGCPCPRVAKGRERLCVTHQRLLSLLLPADVTYVEPATVGQQAYCTYRVQERRPAFASSSPADADLPRTESRA